ncbi:Glucose-1-phosphate adenylyltransferase [Georgfuchsia toluolica]|uniref:Glucose-1-phosphate adenylyltransferase n=2 Tax=Georgfuchsia toluolica TaxID=424218 RepID=A0A916N9L2_9PROT|nr:Glucose-1-phosphate adenylyltransferase [Georgfuchsia toluolica]
MISPRVVAFVMAGGEGRRLRPLTVHYPKPALPVSGAYRLIDFALSNLYNSKVRSIYVLAQYCPEPLLRHIAHAWMRTPARAANFVQPLLASGASGLSPYKGTADSVRQNLHLVDRLQPDIVAVFAADHIYRMDVRQMIDFHRERNADATVAAIPVPIECASRFGVISADQQGCIHGFDEKPQAPQSLPDDPDLAYASMGNYLFRPEVLRQALAEAAQRGEHDFGLHVLPHLISTHRVCAYNFGANKVPGLQPHEERSYWRDVGTVEAYVAAQHDIAGPTPRFDLHNTSWPIHPLGLAAAPAKAGRDTASVRWPRVSVAKI